VWLEAERIAASMPPVEPDGPPPPMFQKTSQEELDQRAAAWAEVRRHMARYQD